MNVGTVGGPRESVSAKMGSNETARHRRATGLLATGAARVWSDEKPSKDLICDYIFSRLITMDNASKFDDSIWEIDAAMELFVKHDHDRVRQEIDDAQSMQEQRAEFLSDYKEARREAAKPKKARIGHGAAGGGGGEPRRFEVESTIPQSLAKTFLPPGATIWRGVVKSTWHCHFHPCSRVSESWLRGGERIALKRILKRVWFQYADYYGLDVEDVCNVAGLF